MSIRVALNHRTEYRYDRPVSASPQIIRLRPAPHTRTPVLSYSLKVSPQPHFLNWQQDPQSNWLARVVFPEKITEFVVEVDLVADLVVFNPFDFFLDEGAEKVPFDYPEELAAELAPFRRAPEPGPLLRALAAANAPSGEGTIDFLMRLNQMLQQRIEYTIRLEPGVQTPEQTLQRGIGSCRDTSWLLVQLLRQLGFAARFVSGYLIQLKPDVEALDGPSGPDRDFTDLHAWCEVYVPGAGWIGLDPTSGLSAGEGHIPLAATPQPLSAAPVTGAVESCEVTFRHTMSVSRFSETPRVTRPFSDEQWAAVDALGQRVDEALRAGDVRLTMGGEPTFVSIDDMQGDEWNTAAVGPMKQPLAADLLRRLHRRFAPNGLMSYGQGKWYPGEPLPRWAYSLIWRTDGVPLWHDSERLALVGDDAGAGEQGQTAARAEALIRGVAQRLAVDPDCAQPAFEDPLAVIKAEADLPEGVSLDEAIADDPVQRARLARILSQGVGKPRAWVLPVQRWQARAEGHWLSEVWRFRRGRLHLIPGDSPAGLRLPLDRLPGGASGAQVRPLFVRDPADSPIRLPARFTLQQPYLTALEQRLQPTAAAGPEPQRRARYLYASGIRTALVVEPVAGLLSVFIPPVSSATDYLELIAAVEDTAAELDLRVRVEGYPPPHDAALQQIKITPDPGVIEVNIHPSADWNSLRETTLALYEEARRARLGTEKFLVDGRHVGTGGGNHIVVGGASPSDSPFLRRPDLLGSMIRYWQHHPSLSYLFAGLFIGPTSQSPRVDEARNETLYELELALSQLPGPEQHSPPWLVDRILRNLLVDVTGNTHRAEICIDKLFSPDSPTGRLGLVELRAFEMPPHPRMSLVQQLLVRALIAWFWRTPFCRPLIDWGSRLHDEMFLPHFLTADLHAVLDELRSAGFPFENHWLAPQVEFRFPRLGEHRVGDIELELRAALEAWPTMGEEGAPGGTTRYVDSSVERVQLTVRGLRGDRHVVLCNGRRLPLSDTGIPGVQVAGVRYRAWQPWSCLHPTIGAHNPLTFDVIDTWNRHALGGCSYFVTHPGGRNYETNPVNSNEAEARRQSRFFAFGHTPGTVTIPPPEHNPYHPRTLDLRRPPRPALD